MKTIASFLFFCLLFTTAWSQLRLNVDGNASVSGNLTTGGVTTGNLNISGFSPVRITTSSTAILDLRASNPLIEFRDNTPQANYLGFIQFFGTSLYVANRQAGSLFFRTNNLDRMTIDGIGNVGIGTTSPGSKLTVNGPDNNGSVAGLEVNSGAQKLIMDGNEIDCTTDGLHFNFNSKNDLLFRTNERLSDITISHDNGSGTSNGVTFEHPGANNAYWTWYSTNGDGNLELYYQGSLRGDFISGTGAYTTVSDRRLKQNIRPLNDVLERVTKLQPSTYSFRSDRSGRSQLGFIAQDVQPFFPELVHQGKVGDTGEERYTMDYAGFGVIAIAAIQELLVQQREENEALRSENRQMKDQLNQLVDRMEALERKLSDCCRAQGALMQAPAVPQLTLPPADRPHLVQNVPNPFQQETAIQYYLPDSVKQAEIAVFDAAGRQVRTFRLEQTGYGKVIMEGGALTAGVYSYALVIDGTVWQTLPMVVTK